MTLTSLCLTELMMLIQRHASRGNRLILFFLSFSMLATFDVSTLVFSFSLSFFFPHHFLPVLSCRRHLRYAVFFKQGFSPRTPRQKTPLVQRWESGLINGHKDDDDDDDLKHDRRKEEVTNSEWPREGESEARRRARTEGREGVREGFSQERGKKSFTR